MADMFNQFDDRLQRIEANRARLKRGYALTVDRDGLIVARPRAIKRSFPIKGIVLLVVGFLCFKALLIAYMGIGTYQDRVAGLENGATTEQVGAWFMQADPVSLRVATELRALIR